MLLIAGCSAGDDAAPASTASSATTSVVETTEPTSTTSSLTPSTTVATATPAPTATSQPEPTTAPPTIAAEEEVRAAVRRSLDDFSSCLLALPACDPTTLAATRADPILAVNTSRVTEWNGKGYAVIDRDQFRAVVESVALADDLRSATVTVCFADGSKLIHPRAGPDGADVIVDGAFTSGREAWDVRLDTDDVWRLHDAPLIGDTEETDVCPAA